MTSNRRLRERTHKVLHERNALQRFVCRKIFRPLEVLGFHVVGDHFYEPIPNTREIASNYLDAPRPCTGVDFRLLEAEKTAINIIEKWAEDFLSSSQRYGYKERNDYFRGVDSVALYCFIRDQKPQAVVEIGQGISTRVIIAALTDNFQETQVPPRFTSIDPYNRLQDLQPSALSIQFTHIEKPVQLLENPEIEQMLASNLLFVDSSHVYKSGSDVQFLFERILPVIEPGAMVHLHDIFLPYDYPLNWYVRAKRFWNEGQHLENFLRFNREFEVVLPLYGLVRASDSLRRVCEKTCVYEGFEFQGSSFYMKRVHADRVQGA